MSVLTVAAAQTVPLCCAAQVTLRFQAAIGANVVLSAVSMFGLCYWLSKYFFSEASHRMTVGLIGAIGILVIEVLVFIIRSCKADAAMERAACNSSTQQQQQRFGHASSHSHSSSRGQYSSVPLADATSVHSSSAAPATGGGIEMPTVSAS
jgi:Endoplasmic reticulum-based factor for assembly of V-ATPase